MPDLARNKNSVKLIYIKLNEYDYVKCGFPFHCVGVFNDGLNHNLIVMPLMGEIIFESDKTISDADAVYLKQAGLKRLPADVVVQASFTSTSNRLIEHPPVVGAAPLLALIVSSAIRNFPT